MESGSFKDEYMQGLREVIDEKIEAGGMSEMRIRQIVREELARAGVSATNIGDNMKMRIDPGFA